MSESLVLLEDVWFRYPQGMSALKGISLVIRSCQVVGIVGRNGAGKTTLVRHFNGLLRPSEGRVLVDGSDIRTTPVHELAKTVGYVFQNPNHQLFAPTVQEELSFGPKNQGLSASEVQSRVESALAFFEIGDLRDTHPLRLSFPMRKLVCIASVYAMDPTILILDEPTTGQDHSGMRLIKELIRRVRNEGRTVVLVSHDMPLVAEVAERLIVLCDGEVVDDDDPREVFGRNELLEKAHLQPPQVTQLSQRLLRPGLPKLALTVDELVSSLSGFLGSQSIGEQSRQDGGA